MPEQRELVQPPAVQMNSGRVAMTGTIAFFVAFVVLAPLYGWLGHHHKIWFATTAHLWFWTCLAGWLLGLAGWSLVIRHRRAGRTL